MKFDYSYDKQPSLQGKKLTLVFSASNSVNNLKKTITLKFEASPVKLPTSSEFKGNKPTARIKSVDQTGVAIVKFD